MELLTGLTCFIFMIITIFGGIFMRQLKLKIFHHKILAGLALTFGILHMLFVFVF